MGNRLVGIGVVVAWVVSAAVAEVGGAQQLAAAVMVPVKRLVTLEVTEAPLRIVLQEIAQQAGLTAVYSDLVSMSGKRVTLKLRDIAVEAAFEKALAGTRLAATIVGENVAFGLNDAELRQMQGTILGKVINAKTKLPIRGAKVALNDANTDIITSDDGTFRISVDSGEYRVSVRAVGMKRQSQLVKVREQASVSIIFMLEGATRVLDDVVVTGTVIATKRRAIATPITVITAEDIERRGITRIDQLMRGDIPGLLAAELGSHAYSDTSFGMSGVRMFSRGQSRMGTAPFANPIKTYVDGVELVDPSYLGTIDPQSIERIEVITGPQAATVYGSGALGGVMQIFTKRGTGSGVLDATLRSSYGILQTNINRSFTPTHSHSLLVNGGAGPILSYAATFTYNYSGQWQPSLFARNSGVSLGASHETGPVVVNGNLSMTNSVNGVGRTRSFSPYGMAKRATGEWISDSYYNAARTQQPIHSQSNNLMLTFNADVRTTPNWQHHATVGRTQNNQSQEPQAPSLARPADSLSQVRTRRGHRLTLGYNTTYIITPVAPLSIAATLGVNGSRSERIDANGSFPTLSQAALLSPSVSMSVYDKSWGLFAQARVGMFDRFFITGGVRGERNPRTYGQSHRTDWTPTTGATYTIEYDDVTVKLLASYGQATKPPTPDQREEYVMQSSLTDPSTYLYRFANSNLRPEYERGPQGGIEVYYANAGSFTLNYFRQYVQDLIHGVVIDSILLTARSTGSQRWQVQTQNQNLSKIDKYGLEATASFNIWTLDIKGAYTWNESKVGRVGLGDPNCTDFCPGMSFMFGTPTHFGSFQIGYALGGTNVLVSTQIMGRAQLWSGNAGYPGRDERTLARIRTYIDRNIPTSFAWKRKGYAKSSIVVTQRLRPWLSTTANIQNVFNAYNSELGPNEPSLGRQSQFGIVLTNPR